MREYDCIGDLLQDIDQYEGIHIECSQDAEDEILSCFRQLWTPRLASFIVRSDRGYARQSVREYLRFFEQLMGSKRSYKEVLREFGLEDIKKKRMRTCTASEHMRINFARISLGEKKLCFLENPLSDVDGKSQELILRWLGSQVEAGVKLITTTRSLRHALLLPGAVFYQEEHRYIEVPQEESEPSDQEPASQKIAAKSGTRTLLFDPKDIDYIESLNKANFLSVRDSSYQVSYTLDELEKRLKKFGFFRCHRSYLVNVQKVEALEKWTKNSYSLRLNNSQHSQVPLSKGRVAEMKELYGW